MGYVQISHKYLINIKYLLAELWSICGINERIMYCDLLDNKAIHLLSNYG